ncbi:MAG: cytochrome c [Magnetococcales bacterium]|nr:cytochrome c [Magnetococcales bacterium]
MKKACLFTVLLTMAIGTASPGRAADAEKGKLLHDPSCMTNCHASKANGDANSLYTRKERRMTSLEKLKSQVSFCNQQVLNTQWWPEDEANVVEYLNRAFYKFP